MIYSWGELRWEQQRWQHQRTWRHLQLTLGTDISSKWDDQQRCLKVSNQNLSATPRYLSSWLGHHIEKKFTVYPVLSEISVGTGHYYSPVLVTLAQKEKSKVSSTHPAEVTSELSIPFFFFFFCYRIPHRKCAESAPFWQAEEQIYAKPSRENHQKMGICWISACFLPGFPQTVLASTRVWTLPMPAKSWACSAKCDIAKETGKGCYKVILSPQKNGKSSNKM